MKAKLQTPNARKQAAFVQRKAALGYFVVRGLYAHRDDHMAIKAFATILRLTRASHV